MRICLVSQEYPPETAHGGIATQTRGKARGLAALGHEVTVLSHAAGPKRSERMDGPVRVLRVPGPEGRQPVRDEAARWLLWSGEVAAALEALDAERSFDLIDFPEWGGEGFLWLLNHPAPRRPPVVVHLQGPLALLHRVLGWPLAGSPLLAVGSLMEGESLRLADAVLSSSRFSARVAAEAYGLPIAGVPVVHAGVDLDLFRPPPAPPAGPPVVLFVGRVARSKGADVLAEAALRVAPEFPGLRVRFVGRVEAALPAAPEGLFEVVGPLPRERLPEELSRATLFAAPSPCEGGPGFACLEAMAAGLPVIACSGTGVEEAVLDGSCGLLVPPGEVEALAAALRRLLTDPALRAAMAAAARARAESIASPLPCARILAAHYVTTLGSDPKPPF